MNHAQTLFSTTVVRDRFRALLKGEIQFNSAVYPIMKCLRVLIAAFERQVKAIDWHLNQGAGVATLPQRLM
jgi:hypothetical protein